jgi:hypothetical protein
MSRVVRYGKGKAHCFTAKELTDFIMWRANKLYKIAKGKKHPEIAFSSLPDIKSDGLRCAVFAIAEELIRLRRRECIK